MRVLLLLCFRFFFFFLQQGVYRFDMQSDGTKSESAQSVISQEDLTFLSSPPIVLPVNK